MIRLSILYPRTEGARFDTDYYVNTHLPMVRERLVPMGLLSVTADQGMAQPTPSPYLMVACMSFASAEDMRVAMKAHGRALAADMANFTDIAPHTQIGEQIFG